jgi:hypothetical protein
MASEDSIWFPSSGLGTPALEAPASNLVVDGEARASEITFPNWSLGTRGCIIPLKSAVIFNKILFV